MNNTVSIITPVYNAEKYIEQTIVSVLNQTYTNWEQIFVDDCSSDQSESIIKAFQKKDSRIKYYCLDKNSGAGVARNEALKIAKGRYIAFLDSDDFWHSEKLEKQVQVLKEKKLPIVYTQYYVVKEESNIPDHVICSPETTTYRKMLRNDYIGFLTLMYDTNILGKQFMPEIRRRQDWAYKLRLCKDANYAYGIQEPLAYYRVRNASLSSNKFKLLKYNYAIYKEVLGFSTLKSFLYMINFLTHYFYYKNTSKKKL